MVLSSPLNVKCKMPVDLSLRVLGGSWQVNLCSPPSIGLVQVKSGQKQQNTPHLFTYDSGKHYKQLLSLPQKQFARWNSI